MRGLEGLQQEDDGISSWCEAVGKGPYMKDLQQHLDIYADKDLVHWRRAICDGIEQ